jgi:GATA-binding protein, other eukaryote
MKKSIIKRRKRVVPALREQSPSSAQHSPPASSTSPETSPVLDAQSSDGRFRSVQSEESTSRKLPLPQPSSQSHHPPPIDFTGFNTFPIRQNQHPSSDTMSISNPSPPPRPTSLSPNPHAATPAKRPSPADETYTDDSESSRSNRLHSISSLLNPHALHSYQKEHQLPITADDMRLDPSLLALSRQQQASVEAEAKKAERRAQLQQEAERIRKALRMKERELAELG